MKTAVLLFPLLAAPVPHRPPDDLAPGEVVEGEIGYQLDDYLSRLEGVGFSGIVGVEHEGAPVLVRGYGMADREHGRPVTPDTVFCTGSITKQFTAAAILALQEEKKLSVQDGIERFFPDVPEDKRAITLHHLLTHSSGLLDPNAGDYDLVATKDWVLAQALHCELEWPPGSGYAYRNVNFSLLGMIVERVSGEPYEEYLHKRLFERADMRSTGYWLPHFAPEAMAIGYRDGEPWGTTMSHAMLPDGPCWTLRANGGIQSTVGDMLRWDHALRGAQVLSAESVAMLQTPYVSEGGGSFYGYGWSIQEAPGGGKLVAHNGGNTVFFADFLRYVDDGWTIFLATNVGSRTSQDLAYDLAAIVFGRTPQQPPETIERDPEMLSAYAGLYALDGSSSFSVENGGDRLVLRADGALAERVVQGETPADIVERTRTIAAAAIAGDLEPFERAHGASGAPAEARTELAGDLQRWSERLGSFRELGTSAARPFPGRWRVAVEMRFERGSGYLVLGWRSGSLTGFSCADELPFAGAAPVELFPLSKEEFRAYDGQSNGLGLRVRFALNAEGHARALELGDPAVRAEREKSAQRR